MNQRYASTRLSEARSGKASTALLPDIVGHIVLPLVVIELVDRNPLLFGHSRHRFPELLGDLPGTTGDGIGLPNRSCMKAASPPVVASRPMYPFRYNRSRHSASKLTCPLSSSGMPGMAEILRYAAAGGNQSMADANLVVEGSVHLNPRGIQQSCQQLRGGPGIRLGFRC